MTCLLRSTTRQQRCGRTRLGFTLVELLISVTIIIALVGIVTLGSLWGRNKAQASSCLSSIKQLGLAGELYLSDYDHVFPLIIKEPFRPGLEPLSSWANWRNDVAPYLGADIRCPKHTFSPLIPANFKWGYSINNLVNSLERQNSNSKATVFTFSPKNQHIVENLANTIFFSECDSSHIATSGWTIFGVPIFHGLFVADIKEQFHNKNNSGRHSDGANYVLMDGSARWIHYQQAGYGDHSPYKFRF